MFSTSMCQEFCPQWGQVYTPGRHPPPTGRDTPRQTATAAEGTHPTGMHSCYLCMSKLHFFLRTNIDLWIFKMSKTELKRHKASAFPDWRHLLYWLKLYLVACMRSMCSLLTWLLMPSGAGLVNWQNLHLYDVTTSIKSSIDICSKQHCHPWWFQLPWCDLLNVSSLDHFAMAGSYITFAFAPAFQKHIKFLSTSHKRKRHTQTLQLVNTNSILENPHVTCKTA